MASSSARILPPARQSLTSAGPWFSTRSTFKRRQDSISSCLFTNTHCIALASSSRRSLGRALKFGPGPRPGFVCPYVASVSASSPGCFSFLSFSPTLLFLRAHTLTPRQKTWFNQSSNPAPLGWNAGRCFSVRSGGLLDRDHGRNR